MKRFFLLIALIISITSFSQSLSLNELIKLNKLSEDDFDTYISKKGYTFYSNETDAEGKEKLAYVYKSHGTNVAYVTKFKYNYPSNNIYEKSSMVSFQTLSTDSYLKIKNELKINSFKYFNKALSEGTSFLDYRKGKIEVSLASSLQEKDQYYNQVTSYEISVSLLNK